MKRRVKFWHPKISKKFLDDDERNEVERKEEEIAKKKYKKRKTTKATKKRAANIDLTIVALIIFSILLAVLIYGKAGVVGIK